MTAHILHFLPRSDTMSSDIPQVRQGMAVWPCNGDHGRTVTQCDHPLDDRTNVLLPIAILTAWANAESPRDRDNPYFRRVHVDTQTTRKPILCWVHIWQDHDHRNESGAGIACDSWRRQEEAEVWNLGNWGIAADLIKTAGGEGRSAYVFYYQDKSNRQECPIEDVAMTWKRSQKCVDFDISPLVRNRFQVTRPCHLSNLFGVLREPDCGFPPRIQAAWRLQFVLGKTVFDGKAMVLIGMWRIWEPVGYLRYLRMCRRWWLDRVVSWLLTGLDTFNSFPLWADESPR